MLPSFPSTHMILDFDGTITTKDTISTLANIGLSSQKPNKNLDLSKSWDEVVSKYSQDYSEHIEHYEPVKEERRTLDEEITFQRNLKGVELRSFERVSNSGIFEGMSEREWENAGREAVRKGDVVARKGFNGFIELLEKSEILWDIVSVNFCDSFIRGVLLEVLGELGGNVRILANFPDDKGMLRGAKLEGDPDRRILATSDSKLLAMLDVLQPKDIVGESRAVYIGDSGTDIECLTEAGVLGIIMSDDGESSLMKTMRRVGWQVFHVGEIEDGKQESLRWARDFDEIRQSPLLKGIGQWQL